MSFTQAQDIAKQLTYTEYADRVCFVYDGWLGFNIYVKPGMKLKAGSPYDKNTQKSLDYEKSYGPIFNAAYKLAWKMLVEPKKNGNQMSLDLDLK